MNNTTLVLLISFFVSVVFNLATSAVGIDYYNKCKGLREGNKNRDTFIFMISTLVTSCVIILIYVLLYGILPLFKLFNGTKSTNS